MNEASLLISGVAIGSGWQAVVAYVNLTTYYVIGLPIGCVLGFKTDLGAAVSPNSFSLSLNGITCCMLMLTFMRCVFWFFCDQGLWWGMIIGVLLQTATLIFITARTNWNSEVMSSFRRIVICLCMEKSYENHACGEIKS